MIMIVKTPGSQMGSPAAAEEGGEEEEVEVWRGRGEEEEAQGGYGEEEVKWVLR